MWFGVDDGVVRYDGVHWTTYTPDDSLLGAPVKALCAMPDGRLYVGTKLGISRFWNGMWQRVFPLGDDQVCNVHVLKKAADGGVWAGTHLGALKLGQEKPIMYTRADKAEQVRALMPNIQFEIIPDEVLVKLRPTSSYSSVAFSDVTEGREGTLWFAFQTGEILRKNAEGWRLYTEDDGLDVGGGPRMAMTQDGILWVVTDPPTSGVSRFDPAAPAGKRWASFFPSEVSGGSDIYSSILTGQDGTLWIGCLGSLHALRGNKWVRYRARMSVRVIDLLETHDGALWIAGKGSKAIRIDRDLSRLVKFDGTMRFDGNTWSKTGLSKGLLGELRQSQDGTLWFVRKSVGWDAGPFKALGSGSAKLLHSVRYVPDANPPETEITLSVDEVSQPGNTTVAWMGSDPWQDTSVDDLQYAWRLDGGDWSAYTGEKHHIFQALSSGDHVFEVKARDHDFNADPTPAVVRFTVVPPVWQQPWFIGMVVVFVGIITVQARRIVERNRLLGEGNAALSEANKELFTVNKELESANQEIQEQTERKSTFLASMGHELRTPMNAIKGFTNLVLRREKALSDRGQENLQKVDQASDHLLAMINDLLDLSKIEAGRMDVSPSTFDVKRLVMSACGTVQPLVKDGVRLEMDIEGVGEVYTDEARVRQMLLNLLSNALKFTEEGSVKVHCKMQSANFKMQTEEAEKVGSEKMLEISVVDTGKGIPANEIPYLFDEYRQVKGSDREHKGTGLGLSITQKFAELLGGSISVEREMGKGSVFRVRIPETYKGT